MKVWELREALKDAHDDDVVVVSCAETAGEMVDASLAVVRWQKDGDDHTNRRVLSIEE